MAVIGQDPSGAQAYNSRPSYGGSGFGPGGYIQKSIEYLVDNPALEHQKQMDWANLNSKNARWGQTFGLLSGMLNGGGAATAGGQSGPGPKISAGPIWNPQQIDQQVNATKAQNDAGAASKMRDLQASTSGRGFGSNSPLLKALQTGVSNATTATNTEAERAFRQQAATGNAAQVLKGQTAQEQQFASRQDEDIRRRAPQWAQGNALIAALAGLG